MLTGSEPAQSQRFDMGELRKLGVWAAAAAAALVMVAFAASTQIGEQRLASLFAKSERGTAAVAVAKPSEETSRLAESVRLLTADRDRLAARLETLERRFGEVTGSLGRPTLPTIPAAQPAIASPDTVAAHSPSPAEPNVGRQEFGLDLGAAANIEALRSLWVSTRQKHAGTLNELRPIVTIRENARTGGVELRLVAGPIPNAAAAAKLCAALVAGGALCQPALFDGQRLTTR